MPVNRLSPGARYERNRMIAKLYSDGVRQADIARRFNLNAATVSTIVRALVQQPRTPALLTNRQEQILRRLVAGFSSAEIRSQLHISVGTYEAHLGAARRRLGARTTVHLVALWLRRLAQKAAA